MSAPIADLALLLSRMEPVLNDGVWAHAGISCNARAGACHDHLFVPVERSQDALAALRALSADPRAVELTIHAIPHGIAQGITLTEPRGAHAPATGTTPRATGAMCAGASPGHFRARSPSG